MIDRTLERKRRHSVFEGDRHDSVNNHTPYTAALSISMDEFARSTLMELGVSLDKLTEDDKYCIESWQKFSSEEPDVNSEKFQKFKLSLLE